ncbi:hypothetical protein C8A00DRAFT_36443 [Chaetomidium leptoderma]|uniref:Uncharacterized protein n=1 Tax=Chaetomidium leptoderma TaxID=669021 RepID=A0AAN6VGP5_9PEZI|nr:hypothetical protein C8A00DRAFT_36443 [Chaetomidium leptoderma]
MTETQQYERDLRSAKKEWKRTKDSAVKWSHGSRHLAGINPNKFTSDLTDSADCQQTKCRPAKKPSDSHHPFFKTSQNMIKLRRVHNQPDTRRRSKLHAKTEMCDPTSSSLYLRDSFPELAASLSSANAAANAAADPFVYSFDRTDSPGRPLTLEVFVKSGTAGRETEKLVEREYEVLDGNGEAVRGRRARAVLRRGGSKERGEVQGGGGEGGREEDGFELV